MRAGLVAISLCAVLGATASDARACSLSFSSWLGTSDGAAIPRSGTLYAVLAGELPREATGASWTSRPVASLTSWDVVAIDYRAAGPTLEISSRESWSLVVDEQWKPPAEPPQVVAIWHQHTTGCGGVELLAMQLDQPVAAVRVRWRGPAGAVEYLVPAYTQGGDDETRSTVVNLGQDPYVEALDVDVLRLGGTLALDAIRFDGSEVAIGGVPARIALDDYPPIERVTPLQLLPPVIEYRPRDPGPDRMSSRLLLSLAGLAALGISVIALVIVRPRWRARRRAG